MKKLVIVLAVIIVILLGIFFFYTPAHGPTLPTSGQPHAVMSADGHLAVTAPQENALISSPLTVTGTVTGGGWFFEASFPVSVADGDGRILGIGIAQAQANWMSTSSVPFTAVIDFTAPRYATGTVVLKKDNPSGAPANDASLSIPVRFK